MLKPTFAEERLLISQGYKLIAGVDEVGRGSLAGPVVAAAVILPPRFKSSWSKLVRDSKQLTPERREWLYPRIKKAAIAAGVGTIAVEVIDRVGIGRAALLAMKAAVEQLEPKAETLLVDFFRIPDVTCPQKGVVEGDSVCFSIACASIIAKVSRDHLMLELDKSYPGYGLANNKGYSTREHLECLQRQGPSAIHRRSFSPVENAELIVGEVGTI